MGLTVRWATCRLDTWDAIPGQSRWVDYASQQHAGELVVYIHTFRRVRERFDLTHDVLLWKPATTTVAHRYDAGEWNEILDAKQQWPPAEVEYAPRRHRERRALEDRDRNRRG